VFKMSSNVDGSWTYSVIHNFTEKPEGGFSSVSLYESGDLYGTIYSGTGVPSGTIFRLTPNPNKTVWDYSAIYNFCSMTDCADGAIPSPYLISDKDGNLYGTTVQGGHAQRDGGGVVFKLSPNGDKTSWTETILYEFCSVAPATHCRDGVYPNWQLAIDDAGTIYGSTFKGGVRPEGIRERRGGTVFSLSPNQDQTSWTNTLLHSFCTTGECTRAGTNPIYGVVLDGAGHVVGLTRSGGAGYGIVFIVSP
jgi:uncharacterized repeat protein (TIGR03803 family)